MRCFFSDSEQKAPLPSRPSCGACGLYKHCLSPKMLVDGEGKRRILVVGEAPGAQEDSQGKPFVGPSGQVIRRVLRKLGVDLSSDCWTTNAAICRPTNNQLPPKAIDYCRPSLFNTIERLKPQTIILLGLAPVRSLIGWLWKENVGPMGRWTGWTIPLQKWNCWVCPTWHPSFIMRVENQSESEVATLLFEKHLKTAVSFNRRPWKEVPKKQIKIVLDDEEAAAWIKKYIARQLPVAVDYETTGGPKPDGGKFHIYSCSVSDGNETVSYPWQGEAIKATKELMESSVPKVASNMKFEIRWSWANGINPRNFVFDTMEAAHVLDPRPKTTGLKFQSFVNLGQEDYSDHIKPYLEGKGRGGYERNRIKEVELNKLLFYGGLDALLEIKLAKIQSRKLGISL